MFYKTGVDVTNDKQMFKFLKEHFEYYTMNTWNRGKSIANNVKLYNLQLSGDWAVAFNFLNSGEYDTINWMIADWLRKYPGYEVYFNGRSGGYLVLYNKNSRSHVLPDEIVDSDTYEEYKECCKDYYGSVRNFRSELVYYTRLVQDFDRLCDELRDYCDRLSNLKYEVVEMEKTVEAFNDRYVDDLELLGFKQLHCDGYGKVDVNEIITFVALFEAFANIADRTETGYKLEIDDDGYAYYTNL